MPLLHNAKYVLVPGVANGTQKNHDRLAVVFDAYIFQILSKSHLQAQNVLLKLPEVKLQVS